MDIDFGFLCDFAQQEGKINALGIGIQTIYAPKVPVTHPHVSLVARIRMSIAEVGSKKLRIDLIDSDGNSINPQLEFPVDVERPPSGTEATLELVANLNNLKFPKYGDYAFHISVDGHQVHRIGFMVAKPPATV